VAVGQVDGQGKQDIVVGSPGGRHGGSVTVVHGADTGFALRGNTRIDQGTRGVPGSNERGDFFGAAVALLDHDGDRRLDLDVAAPYERRGTRKRHPGRVTVLYGGDSRRSRQIASPGGTLFGQLLGDGR
jgi:hypothetical protein